MQTRIMDNGSMSAVDFAVIELGWGLLALICAGVLLAWFWHDSMAARERANVAALDACRRLNLQLLDGTVAFARLSPTRTAGGRLELRRTYVFDYTANSLERRQGFVILSRERVESIGFSPGEDARAGPAPVRCELRNETTDSGASNVPNLQDRRAHQQRPQSDEWPKGRRDPRS